MTTIEIAPVSNFFIKPFDIVFTTGSTVNECAKE